MKAYYCYRHRCSRLLFWVRYFIYFEFTPVLFSWMFLMDVNSFITDWTDYVTFRDYVKNNVLADYTDYTDFRDYFKNVFITDYADYIDIQDFVKNAHHWLRSVPSPTSNNSILQEQCSLTCFTCHKK